MDFQLPNRQMPPPQFGQPVQQPISPEQLAAVNGNGVMPNQAQAQQYGQPQPDDAYLNHPKNPGIGANSMSQVDPTNFSGSQSALAEAMTANPGGGYLSRGLGGAPAPNPQLQGVAQQVRPPPMLRASPQPNRIAGYPAYRQR